MADIKRGREHLLLRIGIGAAQIATLLIGITILLGAAMGTSYGFGRTWQLVAMLGGGVASFYLYYLLGVRRVRDAAMVAFFVAAVVIVIMLT